MGLFRMIAEWIDSFRPYSPPSQAMLDFDEYISSPQQVYLQQCASEMAQKIRAAEAEKAAAAARAETPGEQGPCRDA